jgi:hypothetical protein
VLVDVTDIYREVFGTATSACCEMLQWLPAHTLCYCQQWLARRRPRCPPGHMCMTRSLPWPNLALTLALVLTLTLALQGGAPGGHGAVPPPDDRAWQDHARGGVLQPDAGGRRAQDWRGGPCRRWVGVLRCAVLS